VSCLKYIYNHNSTKEGGSRRRETESEEEEEKVKVCKQKNLVSKTTRLVDSNFIIFEAFIQTYVN